MKLNILVVSAGSLVGQNILDVLHGRRSDIRLIATNSQANEPSLFDFDQVYLTPTSLKENKTFEDRLLAIIKSENPDIIIPARDDDVLVLAKLADSFSELTDKVVGVGSHAANVMYDKWLSYKLCLDLGIPFVPSIISCAVEEIEQFVKQHGYPLLAKPRAGFGSRGIFLCRDANETMQAVSLDGYMIQKYWGNKLAFNVHCQQLKKFGVPLFHSFEETKCSMQSFIHKDGSHSKILCTLHTMKNGVSHQVKVSNDADLYEIAKLCCKAFAKIGWQGPLNIQGQRNEEGVFAVYEFNGRFTGATAARHSLGYDELKQALDSKTSFRLPAQSAIEEVNEVTKSLYCRDIVNSDIDKLKESGSWEKPL